MPWTVLVGVVCTLLYGVGALAVLPSILSRTAERGGLAGLIFVLPLVACIVISLSTVRGLVRRREPARKRAFSTGLVMALFWAVLVFTAAIIAMASPGHRADGFEIVGFILAVMVPFVATAWSLSRPSAKAWFASAPPDRQAARR